MGICFEELRNKSDELYNILDLKKFEESIIEENKEKIAKDNFYNVVLKIYNCMDYNTSNNYDRTEINFILDFEIYKCLKDIIEFLKKE